MRNASIAMIRLSAVVILTEHHGAFLHPSDKIIRKTRKIIHLSLAAFEEKYYLCTRNQGKVVARQPPTW